jgi:DNA repair exonuclease SbcCD ATPase subunit
MSQNMNAMKRLTVENFQSHRRTVIDFAPAGQLTIIIGRSRSGKTAIIRALRWLLYNDPRGVAVYSKGAQLSDNEKSGYCRVGASFIRVTLEMESGHTIIRERTAVTNRYKIIKPGTDGRVTEPDVFEGFGDNVPLEVQEITGVRPVKIGDTELNLNLSEQLDGPFMGTKSMSAPARAKVLGKLVGTEEIDHAGKTLGTDLFRRNQDEKRLAGELKGLDDKIAEYDYLPAMAKRINELENLVARVKAAQERREKLVALTERFKVAGNGWLDCVRILKRWHYLDAAEQEVSKVEAAGARKAKAESLQSNLINYEIDIRKCELIIDRWHGAEAAELAIKTTELARARLLDIEHKRDRLVTLQDHIADCQGIIDAWRGVEQADSIVKEAVFNAERRRQAARLYESLIKAQISITGAQGVITNLRGIDQAADIVNAITAQAERRQALFSRLGRYQNISRNIDATEGFLARLAGVGEAERLVAGAIALKERRNTINGSAVELKSMARMVSEYSGQVVLWENRVAELEGAYKDELVTLGVCPMCGNEVNPKKLKEAC